METTTKALYNSLRLVTLDDPSHEEEEWKVEDYRKLSQDELFDRLEEFDISFDKPTFLAYANEYDTVEELFEALLPDDLDQSEEDYLYLSLFELWRRLCPEKQSVALIADELDYQIYLYDHDMTKSVEDLDDAISSFLVVLEESVDMGVSRKEAFGSLSEYAAHDIPTFLYDYISDLIAQDEREYAQDLVERFYPYMEDKKWFEFLHAQIIAVKDPKIALADVREIAKKNKKPYSVLLALDMLLFLLHFHSQELFCQIAKDTVDYIEDPADLEDLIQVSRDFFAHVGKKQVATLFTENLEKEEIKKIYDAL